MWEYIIVISTCFSVIVVFIAILGGVIYYINNKRKWEAEGLTKLIRTNIDGSMLLPIKRIDPTEDINECEDSEKSCPLEIKSYKGQCKMITQNDGNLILYDAGNNIIWSSNTPNKGNGPYKTKVEENGNYVLYDANNNKIWETGKIDKGTPPYRFSFKSENPCNAVIFDKSNKAMWSSYQTNFENKQIKNKNQGSSLIASGGNAVFKTGSSNQEWSLTPEGKLIHLESGKCLEGNPINEMDGYLQILKVRLGKLDEKMTDEEKKEMKELLNKFGKGDLTDANDIKDRISKIHTIKMNDCQEDNQFQKWMYDSYGSNIRNTKTNWCLGELYTDKKWKDKDGKDIEFSTYNQGIFPCNSEGFKKTLEFQN